MTNEGKASIDDLSKIMTKLGKIHQGIIIGPLIGSDASAIDFQQARKVAQNYYESEENCYIITKADPITFPTPNLGKYAIIVNLNDLACFGAVPYGVMATWFLPPSFTADDLRMLHDNFHEQALKYNISILGGHSEYTSAVTRAIISLSMIGFTPQSFLPSRDINRGDSIYLLGYIGNEGTTILGEEVNKLENVPESITSHLQELAVFEEGLSIHRDALLINKTLKPKLMHDPTEGGLLGALYEMMSPYKLGLKIYLNVVNKHIHPLTSALCLFLGRINPLRLISSGSLIICSDRPIESFFSLGLNHKLNKIGEIIDERKFFLDNTEFGPPQPDELIKALKEIDTRLDN